MAYPIPKYKVGDKVAFSMRAQKTHAGMEVQEVDVNMFSIRVKVDGLWWTEDNLMPYEEWRQKFWR